MGLEGRPSSSPLNGREDPLIELPQHRRFAGSGLSCNVDVRPAKVREYCQVEDAGRSLLRAPMQQLQMSAQAFHRVLQLGRTIAGLAGWDNIEAAHLAEAIQYRPRTHLRGGRLASPTPHKGTDRAPLWRRAMWRSAVDLPADGLAVGSLTRIAVRSERRAMHLRTPPRSLTCIEESAIVPAKLNGKLFRRGGRHNEETVATRHVIGSGHHLAAGWRSGHGTGAGLRGNHGCSRGTRGVRRRMVPALDRRR